MKQSLAFLLLSLALIQWAAAQEFPPQCSVQPPTFSGSPIAPLVMKWKLAVVMHILHEKTRLDRENGAAIKADRALPPQGAVAVVGFCADREGRILGQKLARSSGFRNLDMLSMRLVAISSPLPRLPPQVPVSTYMLSLPVHYFPVRHIVPQPLQR